MRSWVARGAMKTDGSMPGDVDVTARASAADSVPSPSAEAPKPTDASRASRRSRWDILTPCWNVLGASNLDPRDALAVVCRWYWYPVYAFIRSLGVDRDDARDVTQGFFAGILERNDLARLDPARGRFRSWLRTAAKRHLYNELDRARAKKRGRSL